MLNRLLDLNALDAKNMENYKQQESLQATIKARMYSVFRLTSLSKDKVEEIEMNKLKEYLVSVLFEEKTKVITGNYLRVKSYKENKNAKAFLTISDELKFNNKKYLSDAVLSNYTSLNETWEELSKTNINQLFESWYSQQDRREIYA